MAKADLTGITDYAVTANSGFSTSLNTNINASATTIVPNATTGYQDGDKVFWNLNPGEASQEVVYGEINSGQLINCIRGVIGTAQPHTSGAVIAEYVSAAYIEAIKERMDAEHNGNGTHSNVTATTLTTTGAITATGSVTASSFIQSGGASSNGWTVGASVPTTVAYNGNGSYTLTHSSSVAATSFVGAKNRYTRTVTAPTQCANLNGTTQYFSKTSPSGMTFTDDFTAGAWVKLTAYPSADAAIISRLSSTQGWWMGINSSGQIIISGHAVSLANWRRAKTYQSIPLNKWVHISAQLDMSANSNTATTSYVMINGTNVPAEPLTSGTSPAALVQGGNLEVGTYTAGNFFPGKIAQAFVTSAKVTQANMAKIPSQGLTSSDVATYSIVSAFSLSGAGGLTDINTTNANNLTANGSATTTTADTPFTQSVVGTSLTAGTTNYSVTTAISSDGLTETVQTAEGDTIPTSGGISAVAYSTQGTPYGFPKDEGKWEIINIYTVPLEDSTITANAWENYSYLDVPIGKWNVSYKITIYGQGGATSTKAIYTTLSSTTAALAENTQLNSLTAVGSVIEVYATHNQEASMAFSSSTRQFLNYKCGSTVFASMRINPAGTDQSTHIKAKFNLL